MQEEAYRESSQTIAQGQPRRHARTLLCSKVLAIRYRSNQAVNIRFEL